MRRKKPEPPKPPVPKLADHPVLDFINTLPLVAGHLVDCFRADADVLSWLGEAGFAEARIDADRESARDGRQAGRPALKRNSGKEQQVDTKAVAASESAGATPVDTQLIAAVNTPEGLLEAAQTLRHALNWLVQRRAAGTAAEPEELAVLNRFLAAAPAFRQLVAGQAGAYAVQKTRDRTTAEGALAPLAEAAAELLVGGDFRLVRRCESPACELWFYDRTKSHKRRWCSMETCGNRAKVTAFRKRDSLHNAMRREQRALRRIITRKRKALL